MTDAMNAAADTREPTQGATVPQLQGLSAFANGARPCDCPLLGAPLTCWIEGYVFAAVSEFSRRGEVSRLFHGKHTRDGERWSHAEIVFLDQAWPSALSVAAICGLLARPERGVRQAAHTLGLKRSAVHA